MKGLPVIASMIDVLPTPPEPHTCNRKTRHSMPSPGFLAPAASGSAATISSAANIVQSTCLSKFVMMTWRLSVRGTYSSGQHSSQAIAVAGKAPGTRLKRQTAAGMPLEPS